MVLSLTNWEELGGLGGRVESIAEIMNPHLREVLDRKPQRLCFWSGIFRVSGDAGACESLRESLDRKRKTKRWKKKS